MKIEEEIWELVDKKKDNFIELSDRIFDAPEILYKEFKSVSEHTKMLKKDDTRDLFSSSNHTQH